MPRPRLLTDHQRAVLLTLPHPNEARLIARYYTFSESDLKIIQQPHDTSNQFALAVHLCFLRYPGRVWQIDETVSDYINSGNGCREIKIQEGYHVQSLSNPS